MRASVPVRTCDIGGWTDTWFGGPGRVVNAAVSPGVQVTIQPATAPTSVHDRFVAAALQEYPPPVPVDVQLSSGVPAGSALGTSSSLSVALIGALLALRARPFPAGDVARAAHRLETEVLGEECGVQDQLCAAYGGIGYISIDDYPVATVETLPAWPELGNLLSTVYLGRPHRSSDVHAAVIARGDRDVFARLRSAAEDARSAVLARNLSDFGAAMLRNAEAQRDLHPDVVGNEAAELFELARLSGALGWKVNGAGGDGGSAAVLHASRPARESFEALIEKTGRWRPLPLRLTEAGLSVEVGPSFK